VPIVERFRSSVDDDRTRRPDHVLDLWSLPVIRPHYRMQGMNRSGFRGGRCAVP
jgi:hypothetical protein